MVQVETIWRYPVKGLSAEPMAAVDLTAGHGVPFDRTYAVTDGSFAFDETRPVPMPKTRFLMLAKYERLALLRSRVDHGTGTLVVDGFGASRSFLLGDREDCAALAGFLTAFLGLALPGRPEVVHASGHQFTDVSVHSTALMRSVSLINLATVRDLARYTARALDPLRFRANFYFDGADAWSELDWVGRHLRCGDALLRVVRRTRRCPATSVDLREGVRDINLPLAIKQYRDHADCGIYAEVVGGGHVERGSTIQLDSMV